MISIRVQDYGLDVAIYNEFTLADFKEFEKAVLDQAAAGKQPDVLLNMSEVVDFTIDMALEELKFVRAHDQDFGRLAVVVTDAWIKLAAHIAGLLADTDSAFFETVEEAQAWLAEA